MLELTQELDYEENVLLDLEPKLELWKHIFEKKRLGYVRKKVDSKKIKINKVNFMIKY